MKCLLPLCVPLVLSACLSSPIKREPPPAPFAGTKWMLVTERKLEGELPFLEFGDGAVSGSTGCNRIMGRYVQDSLGAGAIIFSAIASTKRMCADPSMAIEDKMLGVLRTSTNVKVTGDRLRIDGSAGALDFIAHKPAADAAAPAKGS